MNAALRWRQPFGLLLLATAVYAGPLAPGHIFYSRDLYAFWHPAVEVFVRAIGEGAWPVWNPYFGFGEPLFANPNFQIAYPPTWLNLLLPAGLYFKLFVLGHAVAGALGVARLARRLRVARLGAFAAGAAWVASGILPSTIGMYHHFAGAAWMPWVVLALERALRAPSARAVAVLAGAAAGQALAGSADMCFMTGLVCGGWTLASLARREPGRSALAVTSALFGAVALAALLAAVQWLPAMALLPGTQRSHPTPGASLYWSLHPISLIDLVVPQLTTGAAATTALGAAARARLFESREPLLASIYVGLPALGAAAVSVAWRRHRRTALPLALAMAALVAAALGSHTPVLPAVLRLPGVAVFRYPPKYLLPALLVWSLLVGLGVDALARGRAASQRRMLAALGASLGILAGVLLALIASDTLPAALARPLADPLPATGLIAHVRQALLAAAVPLALVAALFVLAGRAAIAPGAAAAVLTAVLAADLVHAAWGVSAAAPAELMRYRPPLLEGLRGDGPLRIYSVRHPKDWMLEQYVRHPVGWPDGAGWVLGLLDRLVTPVGARWRVMGSYDGDLTGLASAAQGRLSRVVIDHLERPAGVRFLQLGGIDYVVSLDAAVFGGALKPVSQHPSVYREPVLLLRTPDPLPKAFVAREARAVPDDEAALRLLSDPSFDARRTVVLPLAGHAPAPPGASDGGGADEVLTAWRRSDALAFEVRTGAPGYLVVLEAFDPAWTAEVDGVPAPVLRADLLFRAVAVPAGVHRVEMRYRPRSVRWGFLISAAAAAGALVLFKSGRVR